MIKGRELSDNRFQLDALDGLRGMAVLIVFLSHTSNIGHHLIPFADFSGTGKSGVFLFFVLSSFLLTTPFLTKARAASSRHFLLNYALRRFLRIFPLYTIYLLAGLVTSIAVQQIYGSDKEFGVPFYLSVSEFLQHLFLVQGKGVTWSISVEFRYYFFLPLLALGFAVLLRNRVLSAAILTAILTLISHYIWPQSEVSNNDLRLGYYLPVFFFGSFLAVLFHNWQRHPLRQNRTAVKLIEFSGLLAIFVLICLIPSVSSLLVGKQLPFNQYHKEFILFGSLWSIVLFACVAGNGRLRRVFESPPLRYLGFISFSVYLLHIVVIDIMRKLPGDIPMLGWAMLLVSIAVSHLSWRLVEEPTSKIRLPAPK